MCADIPRSVERAFLSEPPVRFVGYKCTLCGEKVIEGENVAALDGAMYHYDCLDIKTVLDILDIPVKEAEIST